MPQLVDTFVAPSEPDASVHTPIAAQGARSVRVTVYAGSASGTCSTFLPQARAFGRDLARAGAEIVYGGASVGLMGAVADGALDEGGRVVGVIPHSLVEGEGAHRSLSELQVVSSMHTRKQLMADLGDCFVAIPGGLGTVEELFEVWACLILGHHAKPVMLLNLNRYWDPMLTMIDHMVTNGFISMAEQQSLLPIESTDELFEALAGWRPPPPRWK
jgi:uncharacterized protein (TIGR00730 family)